MIPSLENKGVHHIASRGEVCGLQQRWRRCAVHRNRGWAEVSHGCRANPSVTRSEPDLLQILQKMSEKPGWTRTAGSTDLAGSFKTCATQPAAQSGGNANTTARSTSLSCRLHLDPPRATFWFVSCCRVFLLDTYQDTGSRHSGTHWNMSAENFRPLSAYTY